jgi:hypothetical protein
MDLGFENQELIVTMEGYFRDIVEEFPDVPQKSFTTPAGDHLFKESDEEGITDDRGEQIFHQIVANLCHACPTGSNDSSILINM